MLVSQNELELKMSAREYLSSVKDIIRNVQKEDNGKEYIRLRKGLVKNLIEEALPIGYFADKHFNSDPNVFIELKVGNQKYDAIVDDRRNMPGNIKYIEVTTTTVVGAANGYEDFLFRYQLHTTGHSGTGKIKNEGSKHRGMRVKLERNGVDQSEVVAHERQTVQEAIDRKIKDEEHYPENTALIISFDDTYAFDHKENQQNLQAVLNRNSANLARYNFDMVAIVGLHKGLYISCKTS